MDITVLVLAATATAFATGLGAIPVFLLGRRAEELRPVLMLAPRPVGAVMQRWARDGQA